MKPLFIAIMIYCSSGCTAQTIKIGDWYNIKKPTDKKILNSVSAYEKACYNDSTEENVHHGPSDNRYQVYPLWNGTPCWIEQGFSGWEMTSICRRPDHWMKVWKHREPTWEGYRHFVGLKNPGNLYRVFNDDTLSNGTLILRVPITDTVITDTIR